jgi:polyribonucleotide nucleotidyltransferase
VREVWID